MSTNTVQITPCPAWCQKHDEDGWHYYRLASGEGTDRVELTEGGALANVTPSPTEVGVWVAGSSLDLDGGATWTVARLRAVGAMLTEAAVALEALEAL